MSQRNFDLLGDPIPENHGQAGRDGHVPSPEKSKQIRALVASGAGKKEISRRTGLSVYLLNKHYLSQRKIKDLRRDALSEARQANLLRLEMAADKGNVAAIKALEKIYSDLEVELLEEELGKDKQPEPKRTTAHKGKKELDALESEDAEADLMAELEQEVANVGLHS